jgi:hypothetical protein
MALTFSEVASYSDSAGATSYVSASSYTITNGARAYILVAAARNPAVGPSGMSSAAFSGAVLVTGASITFNNIATPTESVDIWQVTGTGVSAQITITFAALHSAICVKVIEVAGDSGTVVQTGTGRADAATAVSLNVASLAAFGSATNGVLMAVAYRADTETTAFDAPLTELGTEEYNDDGSPDLVITAAYSASSDTTPTATLSGASDWGAIGLEIQEATSSTFVPRVTALI